MPAMLNRTRIVIGAVLAPLVVPLLFFALHLVLNPSAGIAIVLLTSAVVTYAGMIVFGIPGVLILSRAKQLAWWSVAVVGVTGGIITFAAFSVVLASAFHATPSFGFLGTAWGAILGLCVALVFCGVARITSRSSGHPCRGAA